MNSKRCLFVVLALLVLGSRSLAWAAGAQVTAVTEPIGNWVITMQWIVGVVGTLILMVSCLIAIRSEAAGIIGIVFAILLIIFAIKAPDIVASFGAQRAIAAPLTPVVITAGQQVLDALQTALVHLGWLCLGMQGIRRGRHATGF